MFLRNSAFRLCLLLVFGIADASAADHSITQFGAVAADDQLDTAAIQAAIDTAAGSGGGTVTIPRGLFLSGGLVLKSNVTLKLEEGAVLRGSEDFRDYGKGQWQDAFIEARNERNIHIHGPGEIDGVNCRNPNGEEGFRGPHGLLLIGCRDIRIRNLTMRGIGNYAILCRDSQNAEIEKVTVLGGHDGLHAQACRDFQVTDCNFRTGDDCIAGCDNTGFLITGCQLNSSCNGFRFGCVNLTVRNCRIWGPGEYQHQVSQRQNMLSAFVHFAPLDRNPKLPSDNWLIEDITIDNVGFVYGYDIERGLWQKGQPAKRIRFHHITATRVEQPIRVRGDKERQFHLVLEDVTLALKEDRTGQPLLDLTRFGTVELRNVTLQNDKTAAAVVAKEGKRLVLDHVTCLPDRAQPYRYEQVEEVVGANVDQ